MTGFRYAFGTTLKEDQLRIALDTAATVTSAYSAVKPYVRCSRYDAAGDRTDVRCTMDNYAACAQPGVVGCSLTYQDVNVTATLKAGQQVRVCNKGWSSFADFNRVSFINGSILSRAPMREAQAMGLLQVLRAVDSSITATWALPYLKCGTTSTGNIVQTPNNKQLQWLLSCNSSFSSSKQAPVAVESFGLIEAESGASKTTTEGIELLPSMNDMFVSALLSLKELKYLALTVGDGMILPQVAALTKLCQLYLQHYCLQGALPTSLMASPELELHVVPRRRGIGASHPTGGLCGLSGTINHHLRPEAYSPMRIIDLSNNQITGQLPSQLLSIATDIDLSNHEISGSIPGLNASSRPFAERIHLQGNKLEGLFPMSWRRATNKVTWLDVHDNSRLSGCVPLSTGTPQRFGMDADNTQVTGMCRTNAAAAAEEQLQRQALHAWLPKVLVGTGSYADGFNQLVQDLLAMLKLGQLVGDGKTGTGVVRTFNEHYLTAWVSVFDGM